MKLRHSLGILAALMLPATVALARGLPQSVYCNTAEYSPLALLWSQNSEIQQANNIFPHPLLPQRAVLATASGLLLTDDAGRTWTALPQATVNAVGLIQRVAFHPLETDTFYIASKTKGVWATTDAGKTFQQVGTTANGLAADSVVDLIVYPSDMTYQTLLAVHGTAAAGVSRSRNAGKSWDVLNSDYNFWRILAREKSSTSSRETAAMQVYLLGSTKSEPDIQNLYNCSAPSELPVELLRDNVFTDVTFAPTHDASPLYVATTGNGLYQVDFKDEITTLGAKDASWASVSSLWGPNADVVDLCLYDTSKLGLVLSSNELATTKTLSGPLVSSFVKDGAVIRPNANGTVFYAVANGTLTIGRVDEPVPVVTITPPVFEPTREDDKALEDIGLGFRTFGRTTNTISSAAKDARELLANLGDLEAPYRHTQITITARLPLQPTPPVSVTADLSRFAGSEEEPLYDDGFHNDGAAGDGVYGLSFSFRPFSYSHRANDWRRSYPGRAPVGITASYADGSRQGAVGIAGIYPKVLSYDLWAKTLNPKSAKTKFEIDGDVKVEETSNPPEIHGGTLALRIQANKGPWSVAVPIYPGKGDFTSYQGLSFYIRASEGKPPGEINLQLRDHPELSAPVTTDPVPVIADSMREGSIASDYRRVIVPFDRLMGENTTLETSKVHQIIFSGECDNPMTLWIDTPRVLVSIEEENGSNDAPKK